MCCLQVGQALLNSVADAPAFLLAHRCRDAEQNTPLAVSLSNGSATRRKDHVPKSRSINSRQCFATLVSWPSVITHNPSPARVVRRRAGMPCGQTPQVITYGLEQLMAHRRGHKWA
jgi:hypothetical protein